MSQDFHVKVKMLNGGVALMHVQGYLDAHTFEQMESAINELYEQQHYKIIVDMAEVPYISSAGAGVFIGAVGTAQDNNGNIILIRLQPNVKEVFDLLGLTQIFTFSADAEAAIKHF